MAHLQLRNGPESAQSESLPGVLLLHRKSEGNSLGCLRRGTRVHFVPGSMGPVTFDLGPARSRSAAYHFRPFAGGGQTMPILLDALSILR